MPTTMNNSLCAVIGAGSWGTALALLLARQGYPVRLWDKDAGHCTNLTRDRENKRHQPGHIFPDSLEVCETLSATIQGAEYIVMVVPSHGFRAVYAEIMPQLQQGAVVVSASKGIEMGSTLTMTGIMHELNVERPDLACGVLSGPSFAREVAEKKPTAVTVAFRDPHIAHAVQHLFATDYFRVYSSTDLIGLEICGAIKNVIALAAGICDGLGYGLNTRAALITRGLAEIVRLAVALGGDPQTCAGLGGLGDLVLTCTGDLSRNRTVGLKLGAGQTLKQVLDEMQMVAEGVKTTQSCYDLAKAKGVEMPILEQIYQVLYHNKRCEDAVLELLQRDLKQEVEVF